MTTPTTEAICYCGAAIVGQATWIHKEGGSYWCYPGEEEDTDIDIDDRCYADPDPDAEVKP